MDTENIRFLGKELSPNKTETAGWVTEADIVLGDVSVWLVRG